MLAAVVAFAAAAAAADTGMPSTFTTGRTHTITPI
jgi:hypothetical protein